MARLQVRPGAISRLDGIHRQGESPKAPGSPTIEQLLQAAPDGSRWSLRSSQSLPKEYVMEEDHTPSSRKSVLAKVKEKAKKWRNTLSKKKHNEDSNATPSWGVSLEDEDEEDEDPEYFGAPMYESEMAPAAYKETARQHPRAVPVTSEKHILTSSVNTAKSVRTTPSPRYASTATTTTTQVTPKAVPKTISETVAEKLAPAYATVTEATYAIASKIQSLAISSPEQQVTASDTPNPPAKTSLSPIPPAKISSSPNPPAKTSLSPNSPPKTSLSQNPPAKTSLSPNPSAKTSLSRSPSAKTSLSPSPAKTSLSPSPFAKSSSLSPSAKTSLAPKSPGQSPLTAYPKWKASLAPIVAEKSSDTPTPIPRATALTPPATSISTKQKEAASTPTEKATPASAPAAVAAPSNSASASEQIWDKGVSVKEYIMHKLEPGEDEKVLSQVISQAISPRRGPGDASVVEKVREAVTSLLRNDDSSSQPQEQRLVFHSAQNSSSNIPISTNAYEVVEEEETHGRILQAN